MKKIMLLCAALLALAASAEAQSMVKISGHVVDSVTHEDLPFVDIEAIRNDSVIAKTETDFDGLFKLRVPKGKYVLRLSQVGLVSQTLPIVANKTISLGTIVMVMLPSFHDPEILVPRQPIVEIGNPNGATQQMEVEGVKVIVR